MDNLPGTIRHAVKRLRAALLMTSLCAAPFAHAYADTWLLTTEAPVTVVRGTSVFQADAPLVVQAGDLLATDDQHGAQLENGAGTIAALGPGTRLAVDTTTARDGSTSLALSMLRGWLKVARLAKVPVASQSAVLSVTIDTAALHVVLDEGSLVMHVSDPGSALFVESGGATLTLPDTPAAPLNLGGDQFVLREPGHVPARSSRPSPAFVSALPVNFRDPLAPVVGTASSKATAPDAGRPVVYADIADWLVCRLPVRHTFVGRFRERVHTEPFRSELRAHLRTLPEWRPVLYPPPPVQPHRESSARSTAEAV